MNAKQNLKCYFLWNQVAPPPGYKPLGGVVEPPPGYRPPAGGEGEEPSAKRQKVSLTLASLSLVLFVYL